MVDQLMSFTVTEVTPQYYNNTSQSRDSGAPSNVPMFNPSQNLPLADSHAMVPNAVSTPYSPVVHHWYYCKKGANQPIWLPFSHLDSMTLEDSFLNGELLPRKGCSFPCSLQSDDSWSLHIIHTPGRK